MKSSVKIFQLHGAAKALLAGLNACTDTKSIRAQQLVSKHCSILVTFCIVGFATECWCSRLCNCFAKLPMNQQKN